MTFYGIKFIAVHEARDYISTQLFHTARKAEIYANSMMGSEAYLNYVLIKFQLQQEHVQD